MDLHKILNNVMFGLLGGVLLLAMLYPHTERMQDKAYRRGYSEGYLAGKSVGLRYADELISEGWTCGASAYHKADGVQVVGIVCTNGVLAKILANEAEGV